MKRCAYFIFLSLLSVQVQAGIRAYFNHNSNNSYVEPYRGTLRAGDDLEAVILKEIKGAKKSIYLAVQELRLPLVALALVEKKKAGLDVRVVIEKDYNFTVLDRKFVSDVDKGPGSEGELEALVDINGDKKFSKEELLSRDAIYMLRAAKVKLMDDGNANSGTGSGLMHHKFMVVDGKRTLVTTANFTLSCIHGDLKVSASRGNPNSMVVMESVAAARTFTEEFLELWGDGKTGNFGQAKTYRGPKKIKVGKAEVTIQFSPTSARLNWEQSVNGLMGSVLATSKKSIKASLFVFSDQYLADIMQERAETGVTVGALIEHRFAYRDYSEVLDMLGLRMLSIQCRYEEGNNVWRKKATEVGVPKLPPGDLLHHKYAVVDNKTVIVGSQNWTEAANMVNDETLIVIEDRTIARQFTEEYDRLLKVSRMGATPELKASIQLRLENCSKSNFVIQD